MDLENQKRVKEFAEQYGPENVVVVLGAAEGEAAGLAAETVTAGDPTYAGPLTEVQLGLTVFHVVEPEMKEEFDPDVYDAETEFAPHEWSYYEQDHILCDEDNERIENPEDYVGTMIEDIFYDYPDKEVLYVRNSWLGEKFQITRLNDSYARAVEGMDADFEVYPAGE